MPTARDHIQVLRVDVLFEVHHRHAVGADSCGGKIDHADARLALSQHGVVFDVSTRTGCIEDEIDVSELWHFDQASDTFVGSSHAHPFSTGQTIRGRIDTNHHCHFQVFGIAQDFDHQVGTDVSGADDGDFAFCSHF
ncbi:hypothetical protein D3C85_470590 [compost metagenome]